MKQILFDANGRLRAGWWMLVFIAVLAITRVAYTPTSRALQQWSASEAWLQPLPFLFALAATWICTRLRREPLSTVGLRLDRRWLRELAIGSAVGICAIAVISALIGVAGAVRFDVDPARSVEALLYGAYVFLFVALLEELLFRGFLFQRLIDGAGVWVAQLLFAALFALGHWDNPEMSASARVWATLDLALGALLFGLAWVRTRSLALPVGMHFGWNWAQGAVFGFPVSGFDQAGWLQPVVVDGAPQWLSGGGFGPEASVVAIVVDLLMLLALWRWRPGRPQPVDAPVPAAAG